MRLPSLIPKERAAAKEAKAAILEVGEALVDRGLLPPQALDKYGDDITKTLSPVSTG